MQPDDDSRLRWLRERRLRPERDYSLGFVREMFKSRIERPFHQLQAVSEAWMRLVPEDLRACCRLEGLQRGVLRVRVEGSARLYTLDRLLKSGLEARLKDELRGIRLSRIVLRQGPLEPQDRPERRSAAHNDPS
ncbi:MAG: DUF721 domain-containing protein [Phycisphaeraceae bacterium]|nr:DUF721 domain-containing protein [Phycisphaeraceae bacterium]